MKTAHSKNERESWFWGKLLLLPDDDDFDNKDGGTDDLVRVAKHLLPDAVTAISVGSSVRVRASHLALAFRWLSLIFSFCVIVFGTLNMCQSLIRPVWRKISIWEINFKPCNSEI